MDQGFFVCHTCWTGHLAALEMAGCFASVLLFLEVIPKIINFKASILTDDSLPKHS